VNVTIDDLLAPVDVSWHACLARESEALLRIVAFLNDEQVAGRGFLPAPDLVLQALAVPLSEVRVLIVGQDPYPTPGHAVGLAFSVASDVSPLPPSLRNILTERASDLALAMPTSGDLSLWTHQGVFLLNRVLTVSPGAAGSHQGHGWEQVTRAIVRELVDRSPGFVALLWGKPAAEVATELANVPVLRSAHPSPLAAYRGFFGSKPFSWANAELTSLGRSPVDWSLLP
jgi:uracil-DNA glycosylase